MSLSCLASSICPARQLTGGPCWSAVAEDDPTTGQVVGAELNDYSVLGEDPDVVLAHLARDVCENLVTVGQLDPEHCVRESLDDRALDLDDTVLLGHILFLLTLRCGCLGTAATQELGWAGTGAGVARTGARHRLTSLRQVCGAHEIVDAQSSGA